MSDAHTQFAELSNAFLALANQKMTADNQTQVAMALLAATARFNAHVVATACGSAEIARVEAPKAKAFLVGQFEKSLTSNLDEYIADYEAYAQRSASGGASGRA